METVTLDYTLFASFLAVEHMTLMSLRHNQTPPEAFVCFMFSFLHCTYGCVVLWLHLQLCLCVNVALCAKKSL